MVRHITLTYVTAATTGHQGHTICHHRSRTHRYENRLQTYENTYSNMKIRKKSHQNWPLYLRSRAAMPQILVDTETNDRYTCQYYFFYWYCICLNTRLSLLLFICRWLVSVVNHTHHHLSIMAHRHVTNTLPRGYHT